MFLWGFLRELNRAREEGSMMMVVKLGIRARPALSKLFKKVRDGTRLKIGRPRSRIHA